MKINLKTKNKLCVGKRTNGDLCMNKTKHITQRCEECWDDLLNFGNTNNYHDMASLEILPTKIQDFLVEESLRTPLIYERMLNREDLNSKQKIRYLQHMFKIEEIDYIWISKQLLPDSQKFHDGLAQLIKDNMKIVNLDIIKEIAHHLSEHEIWPELSINSQKIFKTIIKKT